MISPNRLPEISGLAYSCQENPSGRFGVEARVKLKPKPHLIRRTSHEACHGWNPTGVDLENSEVIAAIRILYLGADLACFLVP
jgi:hypothetical protein